MASWWGPAHWKKWPTEEKGNQNQPYNNQRQPNQSWSGHQQSNPPPQLNPPPYHQNSLANQDKREHRGPATRGPTNQWVPGNQTNPQYPERRRSRIRSKSIEQRNYERNYRKEEKFTQRTRETVLTSTPHREDDNNAYVYSSTVDGKRGTNLK